MSVTTSIQTDATLGRLVKNLSVSALARGLGMLLALGINIWLSRLLTQTEFAFYGVVLSLSIILMMVAQGGYQTSILKLTAQGRGVGNTDILAAIAVTLMGSCGVIGLLVLGRGWLLPELAGSEISVFMALLVGAFIAVRAMSTLLAEALRGLGHIGLAAVLTGLGQHGGLARGLMFGALLLVFIPLIGNPLIGVLAASIGASLGAVVLAGGLLKILGATHGRVGTVFAAIKKRALLNGRLLVAQSAQLMADGVFAVVIGGMIGLGKDLAPLIAALFVANFLTAPLTLVNGSIPKLMVRVHQKADLGALESLLRQGASLAFGITAIAAGILLIMGPRSFTLAFGPDYASAYWLFALLTPGIIVNAYGGSVALALALLGGERLYARIGMLTACGAVPLYIWLGLHHGALGLAAGISFVLVVQNLVYLRVVRRFLGVRAQAYLNPKEYAAMIQLAARGVQNS